ncbi:MAG: T9SS type A sorting domain-containing protein, partial [Bacteroidota bacterium]
SYYDFDFVTSLVGYAAGGIGSPALPLVRKTTDGGTNWETLPGTFSEVTPGAGAEIEGISFVTEDLGWAVTYLGLMFKTADGGLTWDFQDTVGRAQYGFHEPVRDVQFTTPETGWSAGGLSGNNVIARTVNGGETWSYLTPGGSSWRELQMLDSQTGWIVGATYSPFIVRTSNGGDSWDSQSFSEPPDSSRGLESIHMIDENLGWAVGGLGDVFRTTNGGAEPVSVIVVDGPLQFHLANNYPNPFNSSTRIQFELPQGSHVLLEVRDLLGRTVAVLVNEALPPGTYSASWHADALPSGIYFSVLRASDYHAVKKMLLVR